MNDLIPQSSDKDPSNNNSRKPCQKETNTKCDQCFDVEKDLIGNEEKCEKKTKWSKKQVLILVTSMLGNFGCAVCISIQAPFFPAEAEKKGVTPTTYGFVFSAFSLTVFVLAPLYGKYIEIIGARFLMNSGLFVTAICCILFGLLDKTNSTLSFTTLAFLVRIVEAIGEAAFQTANFTKLAATFSKSIGKTYAFLRAAFGIGLIAGPAIGGVLYELGGYTLPFVSMGCFVLFVAIISTFLFWNETDDKTAKRSDSSALKALFIPSVALAMTSICFGALSIGYLSTTLEPHLRQFNLNSIEVGLVFVISGGVYAISTVFWGWISDGKVPPKLITASGGAVICVTYLLIGPAPFLPFDSSLPLVIIALVLHGFGLGAEILASHVDALKQTIANGFPESYQTYGMISGFWASFFQLGNFIGPSIGGVLLDEVGFRNATIVLISLQLLLMIANIVYYFVYDNRAGKNHITEKTALLS